MSISPPARNREAGTQGYYAFLRGKQVTYIGRQGDQHTAIVSGNGPRPERDALNAFVPVIAATAPYLTAFVMDLDAFRI